jgi:hypothetical protein
MAMTEIPTDDQPGFVAENPEHCHACYRLIQSGQTLYLTIGNAMLCGPCMKDTDAIRVADDLVVVIEEDRLVVRRGEVSVAVLPSEVRCLVNVLVEAATELAGGKAHE